MLPIRILIADDHAVVLDGLKLVLEAESDFTVVGEAGDGAEAVGLAHELAPDVVLMDLQMPGLDGLSALKAIRRESPNIAVVILTTYNEDDLMATSKRAAICSKTPIVIRCTPRFTQQLAAISSSGRETLRSTCYARDRDKRKMDGEVALSEREHQVLRHAAHGERSKEMAAGLGITERPVNAPGKYLQQARRRLSRSGNCRSIKTRMAPRVKGRSGDAHPGLIGPGNRDRIFRVVGRMALESKADRMDRANPPPIHIFLLGRFEFKRRARYSAALIGHAVKQPLSCSGWRSTGA